MLVLGAGAGGGGDGGGDGDSAVFCTIVHCNDGYQWKSPLSVCKDIHSRTPSKDLEVTNWASVSLVSFLDNTNV